ncbi:MAG: class I SAM-dependent methyltransferase [Anaerolineales bacterium]|nr:class I SAM-dependent methyltransferase [Anaerolineales bacterium]
MESVKPASQELYAQLYDVVVPGWPGEIDFYRELVQATRAISGNVLEIACGTGRVALQLAKTGVEVIGLDLSVELLKVAREKSAGIQNVHWETGDMRSFNLGQAFGFAIIPGHSFQFMLTPDDQVSCLDCIKRHLSPDGLLVVHLDHQDIDWLGSLPHQATGKFSEWRELKHPLTGHTIRTAHEWTFKRSTQTATVTTVWEELGPTGATVQRWQREPMPLHCVFRFEMEHLLKRTGYKIKAVYGDFYKAALTDESDQMIWVAKKA